MDLHSSNYVIQGSTVLKRWQNMLNAGSAQSREGEPISSSGEGKEAGPGQQVVRGWRDGQLSDGLNGSGGPFRWKEHCEQTLKCKRIGWLQGPKWLMWSLCRAEPLEMVGWGPDLDGSSHGTSNSAVLQWYSQWIQDRGLCNGREEHFIRAVLTHV